MPIIDSAQNRQIKRYKSLLQKKGRQKAGLCPLEGVRLIESARHNFARITALYTCPELLTDERGRSLAKEIAAKRIPHWEVASDVFIGMTDTQHPAGIAATAVMPETSFDDIATTGPAVYLWLYEISEPGNLGTIFRTAAAFSVDAIVLIGDCADPYNPKTLRASSGAVFGVPAVQATWNQAWGWGSRAGIRTVATALSATDYAHEIEYPARTALVIGSEAHGIPEAVLTQTKLQVKIPMSDKVESLNAGVAAGILLYQTYINRKSNT